MFQHSLAKVGAATLGDVGPLENRLGSMHCQTSKGQRPKFETGLALRGTPPSLQYLGPHACRAGSAVASFEVLHAVDILRSCALLGRTGGAGAGLMAEPKYIPPEQTIHE